MELDRRNELREYLEGREERKMGRNRETGEENGEE